MDNKVNYTAVGLFVLLLSAAGIGVTLWLAAGGLERSEYRGYLVYTTESVSGLSINAPVKYRGVNIGQVTEISLQPDNPELVRLLLQIRIGTPVKEDTVAVLSAQGLTGIAYINLTEGSRAAPLLTQTKNEEYPVITSRLSLISQVGSGITGLMDQVSRLANNTEQLLDVENRSSIKNILTNFEQLTAALTEHSEALEQAMKNAQTAMQNTAQATESLPKLIDDIGNSADAVRSMADSVADTAAKTNELVAEGRNFSRETLPETGMMIHELRELISTLRNLMVQLERQPNMLIYGTTVRPTGPGE